MTGRLGVLLAVVRSPTLRRVEAAFIAFSIGEWATWIAVIIYAYGRGGAAEAGVMVFVQLAPSLVVAPLVSSLGDRYPRSRVLLGTYVLQGLSMAGAALALVLALDAILVYALATLTATAIGLTRPVQAAFLPEVVRTPDELTAANVASGMVEGSGTLLGPALAGVLVAVGGPGLVFAASACGLLFATIAIAPVALRHRRGGAPTSADLEGALLHELSAGVRAIGSDAPLRGLAALLACSWFVLGALDILYAVLAFEVLGLGESGVGLLGASTGVGMLAGAAVAVSLVGRRGLGRPLVVGSTIFGVAIMVLGVSPGVALAAFLLGVAGLGAQYVNIAIQTMVQRVVPDALLTRVLGVFEALGTMATAVGAITVPILVSLLGPSGAFVAAGVTLPVVAALAGRTLLAADRGAIHRPREIALLRGIPMFAPLSAPVIEALAAALRPERVPAGAPIIRQGEPGDRYYVIADGTVAVEIDDRHVHDQGPGEGFGEIALLRNVPRTASVTAGSDVQLLTLAREPFLAALTGLPASRLVAERIVQERLGATG